MPGRREGEGLYAEAVIEGEALVVIRGITDLLTRFRRDIPSSGVAQLVLAIRVERDQVAVGRLAGFGEDPEAVADADFREMLPARPDEAKLLL
jgi:hypothetical protein